MSRSGGRSRRALLGGLLALSGAVGAGLASLGLARASVLAAGAPPDPRRFPGPVSLPRFIVGANYEGPADRVWRMWEDDAFDSVPIRDDLENAADLGLHALRVFIQAPLIQDIRRGRWSKLDTVVNLARRYGLLLYVSLGDYPEPHLAQRAFEYRLIAKRLAGNPAVLCYDLRNEPSFKHLLATRLPDGPNPLQTAWLADVYGPKASPDEIAARRNADPTWLPDELVAGLSGTQLYYAANSLLIYEELIGTSWYYVDTTPGASTLDWLALPETRQRWQPALDLLTWMLDRWLLPLLDAVRTADRGRPCTLDHNDQVLASLAGNARLDFLSLHCYPRIDAGAPRFLANLVAAYGALHRRPALLGEFGWATAEAGDEGVAALEGETLRQLRQAGMAGAFKWMLNDIENAYDGREGSFGLFNERLNRKPNAAVWRAAATR